jgi:hypothetical protein
MATPGMSIEKFRGRGNQDPEEFIQEAERQMTHCGLTTDQAKARYFRLCLQVKSPARKWFNGLNIAVQTDWTQLEAVFMQKWASHQPMQKTNLELTQDLLSHKLNPEDVGQMVPFEGNLEYTHIVWAEEMRELAEENSLLNRHEYVYQVMNDLPKAIKDNIEGPIMNWTTFIAAVIAVDADKVKAQAAVEKEHQQEKKECQQEKRECQEEKKAVKAKMDDLQAQIEQLTLMKPSTTARQAGQAHQATRVAMDRTSQSLSSMGRNYQV